MVNRRMLAPLLAALALAGAAEAQDYPVKPVTLIVPWPAGGLDRHRHARDRRGGRQASRPADHRRQQGRRRRAPSARRRWRRRQSPTATPSRRCRSRSIRLPLMQKTTWDPLKDFTYIVHLTGYTFGVTAQRRVAVQDLGRRRRIREAESRQGHLRDAGRRHLAAHRHGADRGEGRHQADACAVQGRRRDQRRGARRPHDAAGRLERLEAAGRCRQAAPPDDLDREPLEELARTCRR